MAIIADIARSLVIFALFFDSLAQAAELFLKVDMFQNGIDALIAGEEWSKAKKLAKEFEPR